MDVVAVAFCDFIYSMNERLKNIENELKNRWDYPYKWFRKQNDIWDNHTKFIYEISDWKELIQAIATLVKNQKLDKKEVFYYAVNRWYNFWSAVAVEEIFCSLPNVIPAKNNKDRRVDFSILNVPFDHKTSVFPKGYGESFAFAKANKKQLLTWLYNNQSSQQRHHFANRLFIIVYSENGAHWKLKAEILFLHQAISNYVTTFEAGQLTTLKFSDNMTARSDIIWVTR